MVIHKYAETIDHFTNFLEEELKGLKSLHFSISITLPWLIAGEDVEDSSETSNFEKIHHPTFSFRFVFLYGFELKKSLPHPLFKKLRNFTIHYCY